VAALETLLKHFSRKGNEVFIKGANLHLVNGLGQTDCGSVEEPISDCPNGLGNLIVGYNEPRERRENIRTGSHNVVVGQEHNFSSFGELVVGFFNEISGSFASVSGGNNNRALWGSSSVSGGNFNTASGGASSVSGGIFNLASGEAASVTGGLENTASNFVASVHGGASNMASGRGASIGGGGDNEASADNSSVSGGTTTRPAASGRQSAGDATGWLRASSTGWPAPSSKKSRGLGRQPSV
jgi:trimeric autotransporter adhesin